MSRQLGTPRQLPPHATLRAYYPDDADRSRYVGELFDKTARHYDTIEGIFGNGGLLYRRWALRINGLRPGMKLLDVAVGTAAVARGEATAASCAGDAEGLTTSEVDAEATLPERRRRRAPSAYATAHAVVCAPAYATAYPAGWPAG